MEGETFRHHDGVDGQAPRGVRKDIEFHGVPPEAQTALKAFLLHTKEATGLFCEPRDGVGRRRRRGVS